MQLPVMTAAERNGELVADFETEGSGLGEPQVMRVGWLPATDEAGLRGHKPQMRLVAQPLGSAMARTLLSIRPGASSG